MSFGLCNYILSASSVRVHIVLLASLVGNLPGSIINSIIGSTLGSLNDMTEPMRFKVLTALIAVCFALASTIFISVIGKSALRSAGSLVAPDVEGREETENLVEPDEIAVSEVSSRIESITH